MREFYHNWDDSLSQATNGRSAKFPVRKHMPRVPVQMMSEPLIRPKPRPKVKPFALTALCPHHSFDVHRAGHASGHAIDRSRRLHETVKSRQPPFRAASPTGLLRSLEAFEKSQCSCCRLIK